MAGLLDLFAIGFESDSLKEFEANLKKNKNELEKYEKEIKETEEALKKLKDEGKENSAEFEQLTQKLTKSKEKTELLKTSIKNLEQDGKFAAVNLKNNFVKLTTTLAKLAIVATTVKKSLEFYEQGEQLDFLANKAGVAVEKLQMLGNAAKRYGGTTEGIAGTLENLRNQYQSLIMGEGGGGLEQAAFKYGVGISSDPEKMLENVAKRMETMRSDAAKWDLANTLGIDEATTRLLMQGQKAYNEELKKAAKYKLYTKEDIERMREYRQLSLDIRMSIDSIFGSIARMLLPAITAVSKVIKTISEWIREHEGAVKIVATVTAIVTSIFLLVSALKILKLALNLISSHPIVAIVILAITTIIALIQDFIVFMQGGESIIGKILEKMGVNTDKLRENIKNFFNNIKEWIKQALDWLKSLGGKFADLAQKIKSIWDSLPDPIKKLIGMSNPISGVYTTITTAKEIITKSNENKLNSIPTGAISTYTQTESINNTNNKNASIQNTSNNNARTTNIGQMNVNVQANNPKEFMDKTSQLASMDNGIM